MGVLDGKTAIVTGAGQGVGEGIALALAGEGAQVAAAGRTLEKLEATASTIRERGGDAMAVACEVTDGDQIKRCVRETVDRYGGVQIVVNAAQVVPLGRLLDVSDQQYMAGIESGALATLRMMRETYPYLKGDGVIINLATSAAMRWDTAGFGAYASAKEAIRALTRAAACEWGPDNIRVHNLVPLAKSPGMEWWTSNNPEEAAEFVNTVPLGRVGECERDIGRAAVFLCGPDARYISGETLPVDGGQVNLG